MLDEVHFSDNLTICLGCDFIQLDYLFRFLIPNNSHLINSFLIEPALISVFVPCDCPRALTPCLGGSNFCNEFSSFAFHTHPHTHTRKRKRKKKKKKKRKRRRKETQKMKNKNKKQKTSLPPESGLGKRGISRGGISCGESQHPYIHGADHI